MTALFYRHLLFKRRSRMQTQPFLWRHTTPALEDALALLSPQQGGTVLLNAPAACIEFLPWAQPTIISAAIFDDEMPPFAPQSVDLALWHLGIQRINDLCSALTTWRQMLRSSGTFIATAWGENTLQELRYAMHHAQLLHYNGSLPRFMPVFDVKQAGMLLQQAGFGQVTSAIYRQEVQYQAINTLISDLRAANQTNICVGSALVPLSKKLWHSVTEYYPKNEQGLYTATFDVVVMTGKV